MPCDPGEEGKRGGGGGCCCLCFLKPNQTQTSLRVYEIYNMRAAICINPTDLSVTVPRLCKLGQPEGDTVGMSSYFLFIKINRWPEMYVRNL